MAIPTVAYVAEGKLYVQSPGGGPELVESTFVQTILDRVERNRQNNEWKSGNMAWSLGRGASPLAGMVAPLADTRRVNFVGVASGSSVNDLFYTIDTDYTCGLFHLERAQGYERRIFHRNQFRATDLARSSKTGVLAFTIRSADGTAHLATMPTEGRGFKQITEGDAIDEAPSWLPGTGNVLLFQSAGMGRNQQGHFTGLSPYAIQKIDLDNNKMEMVVEEDDADVLLPRQTADGSLYFIRRPYQPGGQSISPWRHLLDVLLFPFGLLAAIANFFNVFSLIFSKKPLISAGGPSQEGPDQRILMLYGRMIDAKKLAKSGRNGETPALVPASWTLVCKMPDGSETVMAKHVLSFDLCADGGIVHSNGSKVFHLTADGKTSEIGHGKMIERVAVLGV
jgi:hypothetical protein